MTLDQAAYNIRNLGAAGLGNSDDNRLGIRQIKFWIQYYRADFITQFTDAGKDIDPQLVTDLGNLELTEVDMADAPHCQGVEWGCTVMKIIIPKIVALPKNRGLIFVGKVDKRTMFQRHEANVHYFLRETRFADLISKWWMVGQTIYIELSKKDSEIKYINIRGVVEDPTTLKKIVEVNGECVEICFNDATDEYPLTMAIYKYIVESVLMKELGLTLRTVEDLLNDAQALNPEKNAVQSNEQ
jgi:hypothetical protein